MKINNISLLTLISLLFFTTASAQVDLNKTAQSTMNFLLVGTSPKASALGEAFTSLASGSEGVYYNPSALAEMNSDVEVSLNYTQWIADINYISGGAAYNFGAYGVVGFNLLTVAYGTINGTKLISESQNSQNPLGYVETGPVNNVGAYCIGLSYAKAISTQFSAGGTVKIAGQNLGHNFVVDGERDNNASKLVFDTGIIYKTDFKDFKFGMSMRNFASNIKREEFDEQLPLVFTLGSSIDLMQVIDESLALENSITLAADFLHFNNYSERLNFGIEYSYLNMAAFRFGYQTNRDIASWSAGAGFNTSFSDYYVEVNYSYSAFEYFKDVNRLSLKFYY